MPENSWPKRSRFWARFYLAEAEAAVSPQVGMSSSVTQTRISPLIEDSGSAAASPHQSDIRLPKLILFCCQSQAEPCRGAALTGTGVVQWPNCSPVPRGSSIEVKGRVME